MIPDSVCYLVSFIFLLLHFLIELTIRLWPAFLIREDTDKGDGLFITMGFKPIAMEEPAPPSFSVKLLVRGDTDKGGHGQG